MNNNKAFTCYFCNRLIENETEMGHTTLCSKVLIPCPYKCGAYVERANLVRHKNECTNNNSNNCKSLDRRMPPTRSDLVNLSRRFQELEVKKEDSLEDIKKSLKEHALSIQKFNNFNGYLAEWKKKVDAQLKTLVTSETNGNQFIYIQEKLLQLQNLHLELSKLKENTYKDSNYFKNTQTDFARNLEEIRGTFNKQNAAFEGMWREQTGLTQKAIEDVRTIKESLDEQKAKYAGLIFDLRSVSQISSEAAEKIEILEREFNLMKQDVNQLKINMEILEDLACNDNTPYQRLIWKITDVESKLKRTRENDIVLKSPIFYTHRFGYKIRILLYINGLKKWKNRYALACIHVLKGEYDALLTWPCTIEGTITLRDLVDKTQAKCFSKFIKTKRSCGEEEEDEPQESSFTYIFIPHTVLFKSNFLKDDTCFLDVCINVNALIWLLRGWFYLY
ncbi:unnamed protein product [Ceutorhynchus assimilis]|uniref:MATH domain-containing protein n=1 Tax=Ceutorhynchus assimilis TaxID=467358 RepID=A0A9N9QFU7_9CUCU|nr:unnamed protein product [Ceutorhynchus assimilis]